MFSFGDALQSAIGFKFFGKLEGDKIVQNCLQSDLDISTKVFPCYFKYVSHLDELTDCLLWQYSDHEPF